MKKSERLLRLRQVVECIPPDNFNMDSFYGRPDDFDDVLKASRMIHSGELTSQKELLSCGTTACLAGWGALSPDLAKDGLTPKRLMQVTAPSWAAKVFLGKFFGLSEMETERLFYTRDKCGQSGKKDMLNIFDKILVEKGLIDDKV